MRSAATMLHNDGHGVLWRCKRRVPDKKGMIALFPRKIGVGDDALGAFGGADTADLGRARLTGHGQFVLQNASTVSRSDGFGHNGRQSILKKAEVIGIKPKGISPRVLAFVGAVC